jgi:hypothetical protein
MAAKLSAAQKVRLKRDGCVVVPGVVSRERIDAVLREINHGLGAPRPEVKDAYGSDYLSYHSTSSAALSLMDATPLRGLIASLVGPGNAEPCSQAQIALRFPAPVGASLDNVGIHIDGVSISHPGVIERYTLCAGVLLSDVPRADMGNLIFYPGTHVQLAQAFKKKGLGALDDGLLEVLPKVKPVHVTGKAGDVVLFHFQTAHDKAVNASPSVRYMAYFRVYHVDAWRDKSRDYTARALTNLWLEWPGMRGVRGA